MRRGRELRRHREQQPQELPAGAGDANTDTNGNANSEEVRRAHNQFVTAGAAVGVGRNPLWLADRR